jgi:hypothetical protein
MASSSNPDYEQSKMDLTYESKKKNPALDETISSSYQPSSLTHPKKILKTSAMQMIDMESKRYEQDKKREREEKTKSRKRGGTGKGRRGSMELMDPSG